MIGATAVEIRGRRYPIGARREFSQSDVAAFGKNRRYGDYRVQFWCRLVDGIYVFVSAIKQPANEQKWLRKLSKRINLPAPTVTKPIVESWIELEVAL